MSTPRDDADALQDYDGPDSDIASGNITDADFAPTGDQSDAPHSAGSHDDDA